MILLTVIEILAIINWYSKIAVSNIVYLYWRQYCSLWRQHWRTFHFIKTAWLSDCESVWTLTVDVLNTICNRDCFAVCSLDLTRTVSFWKIAFLMCRWKQIIIISRSWNWTHLQFSTQCSNGCQCVLCNFQWFLFSIMSVTVLYLGAAFFGTQCSSMLVFVGLFLMIVELHCSWRWAAELELWTSANYSLTADYIFAPVCFNGFNNTFVELTRTIVEY